MGMLDKGKMLYNLWGKIKGHPVATGIGVPGALLGMYGISQAASTADKALDMYNQKQATNGMSEEEKRKYYNSNGAGGGHSPFAWLGPTVGIGGLATGGALLGGVRYMGKSKLNKKTVTKPGFYLKKDSAFDRWFGKHVMDEEAYNRQALAHTLASKNTDDKIERAIETGGKPSEVVNNLADTGQAKVAKKILKQGQSHQYVGNEEKAGFLGDLGGSISEWVSRNAPGYKFVYRKHPDGWWKKMQDDLEKMQVGSRRIFGKDGSYQDVSFLHDPREYHDPRTGLFMDDTQAHALAMRTHNERARWTQDQINRFATRKGFQPWKEGELPEINKDHDLYKDIIKGFKSAHPVVETLPGQDIKDKDRRLVGKTYMISRDGQAIEVKSPRLNQDIGGGPRGTTFKIEDPNGQTHGGKPIAVDADGKPVIVDAVAGGANPVLTQRNIHGDTVYDQYIKPASTLLPLTPRRDKVLYPGEEGPSQAIRVQSHPTYYNRASGVRGDLFDTSPFPDPELQGKLPDRLLGKKESKTDELLQAPRDDKAYRKGKAPFNYDRNDPYAIHSAGPESSLANMVGQIGSNWWGRFMNLFPGREPEDQFDELINKHAELQDKPRFIGLKKQPPLDMAKLSKKGSSAEWTGVAPGALTAAKNILGKLPGASYFTNSPSTPPAVNVPAPAYGATVPRYENGGTVPSYGWGGVGLGLGSVLAGGLGGYGVYSGIDDIRKKRTAPGIGNIIGGALSLGGAGWLGNAAYNNFFPGMPEEDTSDIIEDPRNQPAGNEGAEEEDFTEPEVDDNGLPKLPNAQDIAKKRSIAIGDDDAAAAQTNVQQQQANVAPGTLPPGSAIKLPPGAVQKGLPVPIRMRQTLKLDPKRKSGGVKGVFYLRAPSGEMQTFGQGDLDYLQSIYRTVLSRVNSDYPRYLGAEFNNPGWNRHHAKLPPNVNLEDESARIFPLELSHPNASKYPDKVYGGEEWDKWMKYMLKLQNAKHEWTMKQIDEHGGNDPVFRMLTPQQKSMFYYNRLNEKKYPEIFGDKYYEKYPMTPDASAFEKRANYQSPTDSMTDEQLKKYHEEHSIPEPSPTGPNINNFGDFSLAQEKGGKVNRHSIPNIQLAESEWRRFNPSSTLGKWDAMVGGIPAPTQYHPLNENGVPAFEDGGIMTSFNMPGRRTGNTDPAAITQPKANLARGNFYQGQKGNAQTGAYTDYSTDQSFVPSKGYNLLKRVAAPLTGTALGLGVNMINPYIMPTYSAIKSVATGNPLGVAMASPFIGQGLSKWGGGNLTMGNLANAFSPEYIKNNAIKEWNSWKIPGILKKPTGSVGADMNNMFRTAMLGYNAFNAFA